MPQSTLARVAALVLALGAFPLTGCYAHATTDPVWVEAEYTPVNVEVYPRTVYNGRTVYLVRDHWYTRERGRWVYYRSEPPALHRQRLIVQRAPRAPERRAPARVERDVRRPDRDVHRRNRDRDRYPRDRDRGGRVRERQEAPPAFRRD